MGITKQMQAEERDRAAKTCTTCGLQPAPKRECDTCCNEYRAHEECDTGTCDECLLRPWSK